VSKYCTSQPTQRRVFCQNRSTNAGKRIASRVPPVVIAIWVHRYSLVVDAPVGVEGEGEERGGPIAPGEYPPHCPFVHWSAR
jgi:hypothetical protein